MTNEIGLAFAEHERSLLQCLHLGVYVERVHHAVKEMVGYAIADGVEVGVHRLDMVNLPGADLGCLS